MTTSRNRNDRRHQRELVDGRWVATQVEPDRHGVLTIYTNYMCRCEPCTRANRAKQYEERERRLARREVIAGRVTAVDASVHNRNTYSNWGCRCVVCTDDWAQKKRVERADG